MTSCAPATAKPLIVKLTPNTADVAACARAAAGRRRRRGLADQHAQGARARAAGAAELGRAGASSRCWLGGGSGGLSGPAIRAVALAQIVRGRGPRAHPDGRHGRCAGGGACSDLLDAGARLVAIGTESFREPHRGGSDRARTRRASERAGERSTAPRPLARTANVLLSGTKGQAVPVGQKSLQS